MAMGIASLHPSHGRCIGSPDLHEEQRQRPRGEAGDHHRYAAQGQPGAADYLAQSIRNGGKGRWGAVPMPAQPQVSAQQAHELAEWILSLAKQPQAR